MRYENALFGTEQDFVRLESVAKNDGEERAVNRDVALYSMNPSSRNLFMKKLTRSRGAHHLGEYLRREPSAAAAAGLRKPRPPRSRFVTALTT